jgi:Ni,Fe-hydrogenase maturation factor
LNKIIQNCLIRRNYDKRRCGAVMAFILGIGNPILGDDGIGFHAVQELAQRIKDNTIDIEDASTSGLIFAVGVEETETFTEEMTPKVREAVPQVVKLVWGEISKK